MKLVSDTVQNLVNLLCKLLRKLISDCNIFGRERADLGYI